MKKGLTEKQIETIVELLREGKPLPEEYRWLLFEGKQETELIYAGKTRDVDVLTETMAVPLQKVKVFGDVKEDEWHNMLIFGDNLQVLKTLLKMKQEGKLRNADGTKGVRLIYIDPPFATKQEFMAKNGEKAYQDKIVGAQFLEWLRKRLILLRELLSDDGSIYVHLDWKMGHYVKVLMDEIFGQENFLNEVIWFYKGTTNSPDMFARKHDVIYLYVKKRGNHLFNADDVRLHYEDLSAYKKDKNGRWYKQWTKEKKYYPPQKLVNGEWVLLGKYRYDVWDDIPSMATAHGEEYIGFPTQKKEGLLEIIIKASSNEGDIVLDAFAGSGTTGAVAEKLKRRWIMIDSSKFAIYTMIKRMLNLKEQIGNKGKPLKPKPFAVYNAGLYDMKILKELPFKEYRKFALELFQCKDEPHKLAGIELDGYLGEDHVYVFKWKKNGNETEYVMDRGFIDNLHSILGNKIGKRFFIIAPAASVMFLEDYIEKDGIRYYILRIPYSVIDELHKKNFKALKQPTADMNVNDVMEQVGFDFIYPPDVECEYYIEQPSGKIFKEAVIKIKNFRSNIISKKPIPEEELGLKSLSIVMIDYDYNGEYFDMDDKWFASDLEKNNYEIRFPAEKLTDRVMIIYMDVFGNERKEIRGKKDFKK
ncbi:MAG: site-specific DNA-methyltransferase [Thermodesulfovibrio sp.]|nr:site-specific DNA-methyltransferase [Thermodesulfovibrio sp.]